MLRHKWSLGFKPQTKLKWKTFLDYPCYNFKIEFKDYWKWAIWRNNKHSSIKTKWRSLHTCCTNVGTVWGVTSQWTMYNNTHSPIFITCEPFQSFKGPASNQLLHNGIVNTSFCGVLQPFSSLLSSLLVRL